jgi:hypothetical protein
LTIRGDENSNWSIDTQWNNTAVEREGDGRGLTTEQHLTEESLKNEYFELLCAN